MRHLRPWLISLAVVAASAAAATPAGAAVNPTGAFEFEALGVQLRLNPNGPTMACANLRYSGNASVAWPRDIDVTFNGCTPSISCANPSGTHTVSPINGTTAITFIDLNAGACTATLPGCTVTLGAVRMAGIQVEGTPGTVDVPVVANADAIPFTTAGLLCTGFMYPGSGTMTLSDSNGDPLQFTQVSGTDMSW